MEEKLFISLLNVYSTCGSGSQVKPSGRWTPECSEILSGCTEIQVVKAEVRWWSKVHVAKVWTVLKQIIQAMSRRLDCCSELFLHF